MEEQQQHDRGLPPGGRDGRALTSPENGRKGGATGRTEVSRYNGRTHGILSTEAVIAAVGESAGELDLLRDALWEELAPVGVVEVMLADLILASYWRLRRVLVAERGLVMQRVLATAKRLRSDRAAATNLSQAEEAALGAAQLPTDRDVQRLAKYSAMLERQIYRALAQLIDLQEKRLDLQKGGPDGRA